MRLDADALRKVIELERKKGCTNAAVMGGLDRFVHRWAAQAIEAITTPRLLKRFKELHLLNSDYASMSPEQRAGWLEGVLDFLSELEAKGRTGTVAAPPPEPETSPTAPSRVPRKKRLPADHSLDSPITAVKGINTNLTARFEKLGVRTVRDLLYFFPHRHLDYSLVKPIAQLAEGSEETIIAHVWQAQEVMLGGRRSTEAIVGDETGNMRVVWFNNPYLAKRLSTNMRLVISGRVSLFNGRFVFQSPEWEPFEERETVHTGRLVPIYPLTQGLYPRQVRKLMKEAVDEWTPHLQDFVPPGVREHCHLLGLGQAISQAHYPDDAGMKDRARVRLAFDELFLLQIGVLRRRRNWQDSQPGLPVSTIPGVLEPFLKSLPFTLTPAQERVLREVLADMEKTRPMSRLLQGEVGSGKTVVATAALIMAVANGLQAALMAPTEILAEQHFATVCRLLASTGMPEKEEGYRHSFTGLLPHPITVALLTGNVTLSRKRELQQLIADGTVDIIIGTHALIQKEVSFKKLGFAVVDEQHRFGVAQRSALRQKGFNPHILAMTATPIPRTLALTLYGDLDLSVIDQLPPGRLEIKTKWLKPTQREAAYNFIRRQVGEGRQGFIICPLVEESEAVQAKAATAEHERLSRDVFPGLRLGLLHGKLPSTEKEAAMRRFHAGELDILVATPVVEVGIDVPNATVMLIESADRFGLSQLHQFRGRVGRGKEQSYCMLLAEDASEVGRKRLDIIEKTQDGFQLAEEDLGLRGPGEFFGTRQSGLPDLRMAKLSDVPLLEMARREAMGLFERDPELARAEHAPLVAELARVWRQADATERS